MEREKEVVDNINKAIASGMDIKEIYKNMYSELKRIVDFTWLSVACLVEGGALRKTRILLTGRIVVDRLVERRRLSAQHNGAGYCG